MQTLAEIKAMLAARGLRPRHRFGQNFLVEPAHLRRLLEAAAVARGDLVLEVGPGTGTLTEELLAAGAEVVACEIDRDLAALLRERLGSRIQLVEGDVLDGKRSLAGEVRRALGARSFRLVANLPYQVASPLLALLAGDESCRGSFVTVQREVADRLAAPPGGREYGPLSVAVQSRATVRRIADLAPGCFWPPPKVSSAMIAIEPRTAPPVGPSEHDAFGRFVTSVFSRRRKQLGSILGRDAPLPEGVSPDARPEEVPTDAWVALWRLLGTPTAVSG